MGLAVGFVDQAEQVVIVNVLDLVGEDYEFAIDFVQLAALEMVAELIAAQAEGVASGVLAEDQLRIRDADRLRGHDFVGQAVLQHAVLMNAGFVRERVASDDGLVRLHRNFGDLLQQLAGGIEVLAGNAGGVRILVGADAHGHHNLF